MPESTTTPAKTLTWAHTDTRGIQAGVGASFARAIAGDWQNDQASVADLRALIVNSFVVTASLGWNPPSVQQGVLVARPFPNTDRVDYRSAQDALMQAVYALLAKDPTARYSLKSDIRFETEDGALAASPTETGFLLPAFLGAVAIIAVTGAVAAVVSDWLDEQNQIEATKVATDANAKKLASTLAAANQLVEAHLDRENETHQTIAWDAHELDLFETLKTSTKELAAWKAPSVRPGPIAGGASSVLQGTGEAVSKAGTGVGVGVATLPLVLVAGGLFLLNEHERRRAA